MSYPSPEHFEHRRAHIWAQAEQKPMMQEQQTTEAAASVAVKQVVVVQPGA